MEIDLSTKELIDLLVERLKLQYGSIEIKVHDGKWTNYSRLERTNRNEFESKELLTKIKEADVNRNKS